jgi:membrane protease YdiL (CAAX protease family)
LKLRTQNLKLANVISDPWFIAGIYIGSFGIVELLLYYVLMQYALVLYFAILITLILHGTFSPNETQRGFWLALGLVPLIRIVSIVTPAAEISIITHYILIGVLALLGIYTVARHLKYSFHDIGLSAQYFRSQILTAFTGCALGMIDYVILKPEPLMAGSFVQLILSGLVLLICTGFIEELAFRGVLQHAAGALGSRGWIAVAPIYALLQIGSGSLLHIVFTLGVALYFGFVVLKTRSVIGVGMAHGLLNIFLFLVMPNLIT